MENTGMNLTKNGFLVVEDKDINRNMGYTGVYGDVWPLNDIHSITELFHYLGIIRNKDLDQTACVEVTTDFDLVINYWKNCKYNNPNTRLLLIYSDIKTPKINIFNNSDFDFLGYDVAYAGGDYYSAIHQDLLVRILPELIEWRKKLNYNLLFDDYNEANQFLKERGLLKNGIETYGELFVLGVANYHQK
jgi:hypothetical protein